MAKKIAVSQSTAGTMPDTVSVPTNTPLSP
jgi:hypothetical protein